MKPTRRLDLRRPLGDVSIATVDRIINGDPTFPRPMLFGTGQRRPIRVWDLDEVEAWMRSKRKAPTEIATP